ncbi:MAG: peptide MFS transporter [Acidobacteriota bacterium]|nr:peptide MFS transporter [Acidobacteriota bacterium]
MSVKVEAVSRVRIKEDAGVHPKGLYVLFATEMWERFSFYSMLALFTLYLRDPAEGFGWTAAQATSLYANYLMFVYASPLVGGFLADRVLGYRRAVMIGGLFFMAGHGLLALHSLAAVYAALACLVVGNGFFKPNVSTMVGNLYPDDSPLKERAYNIFYMGINVGGFVAPLVMEVVKRSFGFHPAFAVAAFGMIVSVTTLWVFRNAVEARKQNQNFDAGQAADAAATAVNAPPHGVSRQEAAPGAVSVTDAVPDWKRVTALIVIFAIVIVFWMIFNQNGSTLTFWADDNTDWSVSGTASNAINSFWIISLTFPLIWFWNYLARRGREPSTPAKMAFGMLLTALSFFVLSFAATVGEREHVRPEMYASGSFRINDRVLARLKAEGLPQDVLDQIASARDAEGKFIIYGVKFAQKEDEQTKQPVSGERQLFDALDRVVPGRYAPHSDALLRDAYLFRVSPLWLILAYAIISLGELMLSPMGLSLVSKVAPRRLRGLLMGGWFVSTAVGSKLTAVGVYWEVWRQSSFFLVLGLSALVMAGVLSVLLRPLKKAMPGV